MAQLARMGGTKRASLLGASSLACGLSLIMVGLAPAAQAGTLPTGGSVVAGSASIATSGTTTTITQSSQNAVINWQSFSVGQGNTVKFVDPNTQSATLNRVTGSATSLIAGQIISNGAVYLVNPNGIAITSTGAVQTGGGFVASTLNISDTDFMAGRLNFTGNGASKAVRNAGAITVGKGAYVALLGGAVANSGTITVAYGKLGLGSGEQVALDVNGGNFMQVAVPTSLLTGSTALIDNSGTLSASGGLVQLQAAVVKDAVRNIINMSGSINADSATGDGGTIRLIGGASTADMAGTVRVTGSLSAQATGASGNGGFIETSGAHVSLTGSDVTTLAAHGQAGTWLIDPTDFTVAKSGGDLTGAALTTALTKGNVIIQSSQGKHGGTLGNIAINDAVSWAKNTLTLDAYGNINVNAVMNATGSAAFVGITGDTGGNQVSTGGALNFGLGASGFYGTLNLAGTTSFNLNGVAYTIITSLGAAGSSTGKDLQGINGNLAGHYVLGSNIDATATASWNNGAGFTSLGTDGQGHVLNGGYGFTGAFNGLGHTISKLMINSGANYTGLFGVNYGSITNIGLVGDSVRGSSYVGGLVGYSYSGMISNAYATGSVTSTDTSGYQIGGLVGASNGTISNAYATGNVTSAGNAGNGNYVGGLAGVNNGTISNAYATGNVTFTGGDSTGGYAGVGGLAGLNTGKISNAYATGNVTGVFNVGGLVGQNYGMISQTYATGNVMGGDAVGGLVGANGLLAASYSTAEIDNSYATGRVTGRTYVGGLVGGSNGTISNTHATGSVTGTGIFVGGLVGVNAGVLSTAYATGSVTGTNTEGRVGGLVGGNGGGSTISNAYATGSVTGNYATGGLAGVNYGAISNAYATGSVTGTSNVGGLVGKNDSGSSISNAYATGKVTGNDLVGGLVGWSYYGAISNAYATGNVTGTGYVGGLVGATNSGTISNAYATGSVTGTGGYVGGLVGSNGGAISNAYASGRVNLAAGGYYVGGLVGTNGGTISTSTWDSYSTGQANGVGYGSSTGVSAVTSDPTKSGATNYAFNPSAYNFSDPANWVFIKGKRPTLVSLPPK